MADDGACLLAAAIRAAILAKAPRRTVQAVAAAVTGVLRSATAEATPAQTSRVPAGAKRTAAAETSSSKSADELLQALRAARAAQRRRKKERRKAAMAGDAAAVPQDAPVASATTGVRNTTMEEEAIKADLSGGGRLGDSGGGADSHDRSKVFSSRWGGPRPSDDESVLDLMAAEKRKVQPPGRSGRTRDNSADSIDLAHYARMRELGLVVGRGPSSAGSGEDL